MSETVDYERFERLLVHHCAPTLSGYKVASLFTFSCLFEGSSSDPDERGCRYRENCAAIKRSVDRCSYKLAPYGIKISILFIRSNGALIYVYRPDRLSCDLQDSRISAFLTPLGYNTASPAACVDHLRERITEMAQHKGEHRPHSCIFPHEIGLFLGYPYDDVIEFIRNKGLNGVACGCWKVYVDEHYARDCFCRFNTCTAIYDNLYDRGVAIEDLVMDASNLICMSCTPLSNTEDTRSTVALAS